MEMYKSIFDGSTDGESMERVGRRREGEIMVCLSMDGLTSGRASGGHADGPAGEGKGQSALLLRTDLNDRQR